MRRKRSIDVAAILGACEKKRYPHQRAAEDAMQTQIAYAEERGELLSLRVYKCPRSYCGGWHLTSVK